MERNIDWLLLANAFWDEIEKRNIKRKIQVYHTQIF